MAPESPVPQPRIEPLGAALKSGFIRFAVMSAAASWTGNVWAEGVSFRSCPVCAKYKAFVVSPAPGETAKPRMSAVAPMVMVATPLSFVVAIVPRVSLEPLSSTNATRAPAPYESPLESNTVTVLITSPGA